jgi:hypothetical protein
MTRLGRVMIRWALIRVSAVEMGAVQVGAVEMGSVKAQIPQDKAASVSSVEVDAAEVQIPEDKAASVGAAGVDADEAGADATGPDAAACPPGPRIAVATTEVEDAGLLQLLVFSTGFPALN